MKLSYLILAQTSPHGPLTFQRRAEFTQQWSELSSAGSWLNSLMVTQLIMLRHKLSQSRTLDITTIYPALNLPLSLQSPGLLNDMFSVPIKALNYPYIFFFFFSVHVSPLALMISFLSWPEFTRVKPILSVVFSFSQ